MATQSNSNRNAPDELVGDTAYELQPYGQQTDEPLNPTWRSLFVFFKRNDYPLIISALIFTLISACTKPATGICFGQIFTSFTQFAVGTVDSTQCLHTIKKWCLVLIGIGGVSWLIEAAFYTQWVVFGESQARAMRLRLFEGTLDKSIEWFDLREDGIGALSSRIHTQVRELQLALSQPLGGLLFEVFAVMTSLGLGFYYSWELTLVILGIFLLMAASGRFPLNRAKRDVEAEKRELSRASKYVNTAITNITTVKAYNGQDQELWQYSDAIKAAAASYISQSFFNAALIAITKAWAVVVFVAGFGFGIFLVSHGLSPGHVLTTFYACLNALEAIDSVVQQWPVMAKGMSAGETLKDIMGQLRDSRDGEAITNETGTLRPASCSGEIEITEVSFSYPSNKQQLVLRRASFWFPAGAICFIVGSSGSGKSTIGNLLMKFYDPTSGSISLDGKSLKDLDSNWLRQNITFIQQDNELFNDTISTNIELGRQEPCTVDEIAEACESADLHQTLRDLPKGLQTIVGSGGQALSGGQQQRIVLARARLRDSPILILDEATSALDKKSRDAVMTNIKRFRQGKTTIVITHDISQIKNQEFVYVVQNGRPVQEGYCGDLIKIKGGPFATMLDAVDPVAAGLNKRALPAAGLETPTMDVADEDLPYAAQSSRQFRMSLISPLGHRNSTLFLMEALQGLWFEDSRSSLSVVNDTPAALSHLSSRGESAAHARPIQPSASNNSIQFSQNFENIENDTRKSDLPRRKFRIKGLGLALLPRAVFQAGNLDAAAESQQRIIGLPNEKQPTPQVVESPEEKTSKNPPSLIIIFQTIWPSLKPAQRICLILGFVLATAAAGLTSAFAYAFTQLLAVYYLPKDGSRMGCKWAMVLLLVGLLEGICLSGMDYAMEYCGQVWVNSLRQEAMKRVLLQPRGWFDKKRNSVSAINTTLDRHAEEMRNLIGRFAGPCYIIVWTLGFSFTWSIIISWQLTLVALVWALVIFVVAWAMTKNSAEWETKSNEAAELTNTVFTEIFTKIRVVRALALDQYFRNKHAESARLTRKVGRSRGLRAGVFYGAKDTLICFLIASVFYIGGYIVTKRQLDVTTCLRVVNLLLFGSAASVSTLSIISQLSSARSAASYVIHLAKLSISEAPETTGKRRLRTPFPVVFNNLSFTYPRQIEQVLKGISFALHPSSCTGIVGSSGSGKSTIASLLLGLYMPDEITLDAQVPLSFAGVPINACNLVALRNQIAIVAQKPLLFPATVLANIIYGLPEGSAYANTTSAMQAAKEAGIHDFIMSLPQGYSTLLGDGGQAVSGGQAQRIAIARALVRQPRILILDEATSALDAVSAKAIRTTIQEIMNRGRTRDDSRSSVAVVIISHAVEMMKICGHLVVLKDGEVVERGTYSQLAYKGGVFADMINFQPPKEFVSGLRAEDDVFI